jgi:hypothetical protein
MGHARQQRATAGFLLREVEHFGKPCWHVSTFPNGATHPKWNGEHYTFDQAWTVAMNWAVPYSQTLTGRNNGEAQETIARSQAHK